MNGMEPRQSNGSPFSRAGVLFWPLIALIMVLGIYLRVQQLQTQWLTDDEWHAVHKIIEGGGYRSILLSYGYSDYSIPLTVIYKLLADTVGLSELRMRLPMLASGIAFLAMASYWVRRRLGLQGSVLFVYLLAISPLLINYSRYARPYMVTLLLGSTAIIALAAWLRSGDRKYSIGYVSSALLAGYLHLIMVPFVTAPLLLLSFKGLRRGGRVVVTGWAILRLALIVTVGVAVLNVPPLVHDWVAIGSKTAGALPELRTFKDAFYIWFGTDSSAVVALLVALAVVGFGRTKRLFPLELALWTSGLAGVAMLIVLFRPAWIQSPIVFARYMLPALPLLLLMVAAGVEQLASMARNKRLGNALPFACAAAAVVGTPERALLAYPNNFTLHSYYQFNYRESDSLARQVYLRPEAPSPFWGRFALEKPGTENIAIGGQPSFETFFVPFPMEQVVHRQRLFNLQTGGACGGSRPGEAFPEEGVFLRNAVSLRDARDMRNKQIDWVVFEYIHAMPGMPLSRETQDAYINRCREYLLTTLGPPAYEDNRLIAFHVAPGG